MPRPRLRPPPPANHSEPPPLHPPAEPAQLDERQGPPHHEDRHSHTAKRRPPHRLALALLTALAPPPPAHAQFDDVGVIAFPTSATGEAQEHFLRGVAILHSFGWKQAREQFRAAQAIDPDFAMAYWGESLAYNHPLVTKMDPEEPRKALERLGATPEERIAKAPTEREKGFVRAVEILWGEGDHEERAVGYMEAMADLHEAYPDDPEVAAFHALSLLTATRATGDLSERWNVRAGTIALKLLNANPATRARPTTPSTPSTIPSWRRSRSTRPTPSPTSPR